MLYVHTISLYISVCVTFVYTQLSVHLPFYIVCDRIVGSAVYLLSPIDFSCSYIGMMIVEVPFLKDFLPLHGNNGQFLLWISRFYRIFPLYGNIAPIFVPSLEGIYFLSIWIVHVFCVPSLLEFFFALYYNIACFLVYLIYGIGINSVLFGQCINFGLYILIGSWIAVYNTASCDWPAK